MMCGALGNDGPEFILQPMVQPRFISVEIEGDGALRYKQLVRTQLEMNCVWSTRWDGVGLEPMARV